MLKFNKQHLIEVHVNSLSFTYLSMLTNPSCTLDSANNDLSGMSIDDSGGPEAEEESLEQQHIQIQDDLDESTATFVNHRWAICNKGKKRKAEDYEESDPAVVEPRKRRRLVVALRSQLTDETNRNLDKWMQLNHDMVTLFSRMLQLCKLGDIERVIRIQETGIQPRLEDLRTTHSQVSQLMCKEVSRVQFLIPEIWGIIFSYLSLKDCFNLTRTSKYLQINLFPNLKQKATQVAFDFIKKNKFSGIALDKENQIFQFNLSYRNLERFPTELGVLAESISSMNLSGNNLSSLPNSVTLFSKLTYLDLSSNKFQEFPKMLLNMPNLQEVNLTDNKIKKIEYYVDPSRFILDYTVSRPKNPPRC